MNKWAIVGLGFISQRHLDAIQNIGDKLIMACDIDPLKRQKVSDDVMFFEDFETMATSTEFLEQVEYVAICTPNDTHFPVAQKCISLGKKVLCEKPLFIDHFQLYEPLGDEGQLFTVLQLRHNPELQEFKKNLQEGTHYSGTMKIDIHRDDPYWRSWKGQEERSGGLLYNIGIHYFDLLVWFFGDAEEVVMYQNDNRTAKGKIFFENAEIDWYLSIDAPADNQVRLLTINGQKIDLTKNFENLHTKVYQDIKQNKGISVDEAGRTILMVEQMKNQEIYQTE